MTKIATPAGHSAAPVAVAEPSALTLTLAPLRALLDAPGVTELCVNRPGECFVEHEATGWRREALAFADFAWCLRLAKLVANAVRQRVDEAAPLLSASLPSGERVQFVIPPACPAQTVSITIRRPAARAWRVAELAAQGIFATTRAAGAAPDDEDRRLAALLAQRDFARFVTEAVRGRRNILVSGPTGSGKTTFTKALIAEIPAHERLVTIEDAAELTLAAHPNHVRLFYAKDGQGLAQVTPRRLLEACLRMRPDRILLAELRGDEAFDYLRNIASGHPGSITSIHAASAALALEQLVLLVKQSAAGRELARDEIRAIVRGLIDVVIQFGFADGRRVIREIAFEPARAMTNEGSPR